MELRTVPVDHPDAAALIEAAQQYYVAIYGSRDASPVDPAEFAPPQGVFLVGYADGEPVACGAWRSRDLSVLGAERAAEIKRMYVVPARQRQGLARRVLAALEDSAREAGHEVMVLETGAPQIAAIAFYEQAGYVPVERYGYYRDAPESRYYGRRLMA